MNRITDGATIQLRYALRANGEDVVSCLDETEPVSFTLGREGFDPKLEALLIGLEAGERRVFSLKPEQAFGVRDNEMIKSFARHLIPDAQNVVAESIIEFQMDDGTPLPGIVVDATPEDVVIDFNHPLAGMDIEFEVEIVAVQPAAHH